MIRLAERIASVPEVEAHGASIPVLGFGTWNLEGDEARAMIDHALEAGYRHIDTAQAYGNEADIGVAIDRAGIPREEIFLTTKVWPDRFRPGDFEAAVAESLERLRTDRVDLLLLHWPRFEGTTLERTVELLCETRDAGKARHVGVSNFTTELLDRAWEAASEPLAVNQVEYHPFLSQAAVLEAVRGRDMALTAYSPLAQGRAAGDETLREIAERHDRTAAQVALRWLLQQDGVTAIPRTSDPDHAAENLAALDFELAPAEMERIALLAEPGGRIIDPDDLAPDWD